EAGRGPRPFDEGIGGNGHGDPGMSAAGEARYLRLLDLARNQKAAVEAGDIDEAMTLVGKRQDVLAEIRKADRIAADGVPEAPVSVIRQILSVDREASAVLEAGKRDISNELNRINTFNVLFQGAVDDARVRSLA